MESYNETAEVSVSLIKIPEISAQEVVELVKLVNDAYLVGEAGICMPTMERTSTEAMTRMIQQGELIGLRIGGVYRGCIHVSLSPYDGAKKSGIFGMLAVANDPRYRGQGFGSILVDAAERWAKEKGFTAMNLELLKPLDWNQIHKDRLESWYTKRGYLHIKSRIFPHPEILIINEHVCKIFRKSL